MAEAPAPEITVTVGRTHDDMIALVIDGVEFVFSTEAARRVAEMLQEAAGSSFHRTAQPAERPT